jgi:hypothetical protein
MTPLNTINILIYVTGDNVPCEVETGFSDEGHYMTQTFTDLQQPKRTSANCR